MAVRNIARGGGQKFKTEVTGLKELERKVKRLLPSNPEMRKEVIGIIGSASDMARDAMKASAVAAGWGGEKTTTRKGKTKTRKVATPGFSGSDVTGQDVIDSIFSFSDQKSIRGEKISGLAGVSKRRSMVTWRAGKHPKSPNARVAAGNPVAMSLASMLEFGTSNRRAKPAIRKAIVSARAAVVQRITDGYTALLEKFSH